MLYFNALSKKEIHGKNLKEILALALCKCFKRIYKSSKCKMGRFYVNLSSVKLDIDDIYLVTMLTGDVEISSEYKEEMFDYNSIIKTTINNILQVSGRYNQEIFIMMAKNKSDEELLYYIENCWLNGPEINDTTYDSLLSSIKII